MDFAALAQNCAPNVHADTLHRVAYVESGFNPYAIGVVGAHLQRQPKTIAEALATAQMLEDSGYNYSLGLAQVNKKNLSKYGLTPQTAFDPCANLRVGGQILEDCYRRAGKSASALSDAFSCYYSGNFTAGYRLGYVAKVQAAPSMSFANQASAQSVPVVPKVGGNSRRESRPPASVTIAVSNLTQAPPNESNPLFVPASLRAVKIPLPAETASSTSQPKSEPATALLF